MARAIESRYVALSITPVETHTTISPSSQLHLAAPVDLKRIRRGILDELFCSVYLRNLPPLFSFNFLRSEALAVTLESRFVASKIAHSLVALNSHRVLAFALKPPC